jgi:hypothetical protein
MADCDYDKSRKEHYGSVIPSYGTQIDGYVPLNSSYSQSPSVHYEPQFRMPDPPKYLIETRPAYMLEDPWGPKYRKKFQTMPFIFY